MQCEHCEVEFTPANFNQKYCRPGCCWLAWKARNPDAPLEAVVCPGCGDEFMPTNRKHRHCTPKCWRRMNPGRHGEYQRKYRAGLPQRPCERCGELSHNERFCSNTCYLAVITSQSQSQAHSKPQRVCETCGVEWMRPGRATSECPDCRAARKPAPTAPVRYRRVTKTRYSMRLHLRPKPRLFIAGACPVCGDEFVDFAYSKSLYCSRACRKRMDRQVNRPRRRARMKNAEKSEPIFRRKVFERDNWTCRICKKPVQQRALVPHPKAPTVDHILPLALGGSHTYLNVQCAHFICNSTKSAHVVQLSFAA